jgi:predicted RNA methylase
VGLTDDPGGLAERAVTDKAFTTYDVQACLFDTQRVGYLREAIERTVRPGDVVVDAGSGTGLLGMFAARAGAARVYCLELNPDFRPVIEEHARRNGLADKIIASTADAAGCDLPEDVDVIISEVISGGFFYEPQLQIINNLRRFLKPHGRLVPKAMTNYVELISAQEELYGLRLNFDSRFTDLAGDRSLTSSEVYLSVNFSEDKDTASDIHRQVTVRAAQPGTANAVKITYNVEFAADRWAVRPTEIQGAGEEPGSWPALLNPQIIFLPAPVELVADEEYDVTLRYQASADPRTCEIAVTSTT